MPARHGDGRRSLRSPIGISTGPIAVLIVYPGAILVAGRNFHSRRLLLGPDGER